MNDVTQKLYHTKDLMEAAALACSGAKIVRLESASTFYWFVFEDKSQCEQLANSFWAGELCVPAKTYADSIRNLKDRLFSRR